MTFKDWLNYDRLDVKNISGWTYKDVCLYIARHDRLSVIRSYTKPSAFEALDGPGLLRLNEKDMRYMGIKEEHILLFLNMINQLKLYNGL